MAIIPLRRLQIDIDFFSFVEKGSQSVSWVMKFGLVRAGEADCGDTQVLNCPPPAKTSHLVILKQEPSFMKSSCKLSVPSWKCLSKKLKFRHAEHEVHS